MFYEITISFFCLICVVLTYTRYNAPIISIRTNGVFGSDRRLLKCVKSRSKQWVNLPLPGGCSRQNYKRTNADRGV